MTEKNIDKRLKAADPAKPVSLSDSLLTKAAEGKSASRLRMPNLRLSIGVLAGATAIFIAVPLLNFSGSSTGLIQLGGNAQQGATGSRSAAGMLSTAQDEIGGKMMLPNPFSYQYLAGADLSSETSRGSVYQLVLSGSAESVLTQAAKSLGVSGSAFQPEYSTPEYPTYLIGSRDGTAESVAVTWTGTGNWWYNNPAAYPAPDCAEFAKADDGSEYCNRFVEQKPTPELQPTKAEMTSQAVKIFSATGLKVTAGDISTTTNEWGSSAFASLQIDGQDSPIEWSLFWSANGTLSSASGHSVTLVDKGDFDTVSARDAVSRMSDWRYSGSIAQSLWAKYQSNVQSPAIAYDSPVARDGEPAVLEPSVEPTPTVVTVTVNKSVKTPMMIWDSSGGAWIVPGYLLIGDQGWLTPVFSLEEGVVTLPAPAEITPMVKQ